MDAGGWRISDGTKTGTPRGASGRASVVGMVVGAAIPAIPAAWGALDPSWVLVMVGGLIGIPIGLVLGASFGADARRVDVLGAVALIGKMAVLAVIVGDLVIGSVMTIGLAASGVGGVLIGILATAVGLIVLGLPALVLTVPCTIAWLLVMRLLPERLLRDGRRPITSWSRRLPAVALIVVLASVGAVPFAIAATDGRYCPDLQGREVGATAWSVGGERLVVATWDQDWESDRTILFEIRPDTRAVRVLYEMAGAVGSVVVDPGGTTWWTLEDGSGLSLWSATATGRLLDHGVIETSAIDDGMGIDGAGLWWIDGGLALDTWGQGPIRLDPGAAGPLVGDPIHPTGSTWFGSSVSASVDGTVVGWLEYGSDTDQGVANVTLVVLEDDQRRAFSLPDDTYDATLSSDGESVIFLTDAGWVAETLDGWTSSVLMGQDWTRPNLMGDRAAATRQGFQDGQLCFQSVAATP